MSELLTPELRAHIGRTDAPRTEIVTRRDIRKYAIATGQRLQKYLDGDEAPPMFYLALFWDVAGRDRMTPDGVAVDPLLPEFPLKRAMAGGLAIEWHDRIHPGDTLVATRTLSDIYEKRGRSGPLLFYEITMKVTRESGEIVVSEKTTRILR